MKESNLDNKQISEEEHKFKDKYWIYFLIFVVLLFFCIFSLTYSVYIRYNGENGIEIGEIIFTYSDVNKAGSGISLENAVPMSDAIGKALINNKEYFDFSITTSTDSKILYKLLANKSDLSTLDNDKVRVYLTSTMGGYESELLLTNFSDLKEETINNKTYYVLYEKVLDKGLKDYSDSFRLRMWVADGSRDYEDRFFSIKVDVSASQIEG